MCVGELPLHRSGKGDKKGRNIIPEKINKLIVGDNVSAHRLGAL
jgi:hypothetical protein